MFGRMCIGGGATSNLADENPTAWEETIEDAHKKQETSWDAHVFAKVCFLLRQLWKTSCGCLPPTKWFPSCFFSCICEDPEILVFCVNLSSY